MSVETTITKAVIPGRRRSKASTAVVHIRGNVTESARLVFPTDTDVTAVETHGH